MRWAYGSICCGHDAYLAASSVSPRTCHCCRANNRLALRRWGSSRLSRVLLEHRQSSHLFPYRSGRRDASVPATGDGSDQRTRCGGSCCPSGQRPLCGPGLTQRHMVRGVGSEQTATEYSYLHLGGRYTAEGGSADLGNRRGLDTRQRLDAERGMAYRSCDRILWIVDGDTTAI